MIHNFGIKFFKTVNKSTKSANLLNKILGVIFASKSIGYESKNILCFPVGWVGFVTIPTDWWVSLSCLGLETEVYETLGLVLVEVLGVLKKQNFWIWISSLHFPIGIGHRRYQKKFQLSRWSGTIPTGTPKSGSDPFISEKKSLGLISTCSDSRFQR